MRLGELVQRLVSSNMNTHRLVNLCPKEDIPNSLQLDTLLSSGSRVEQTAGIFTWSVITHKKPVIVLSARDLNKLVIKAAGHLPKGKFDMAYRTRTGVVYPEFRELCNNTLYKILLEQEDKLPSVIEIIDPRILEYIDKPTEELRNTVINSVLGRRPQPTKAKAGNDT